MERESSRRGNAAAEFEDWSDEVLLAEYVRKRHERLFQEILRRHGPMIWAECWRVLHHRQDVEAAVQNTWVVFLQKAMTIRKGESLNHWLRSAAVGEALNLRKKNGRRNCREQLSGDLAQVTQVTQVTPSPNRVESRETLEIINTEVRRLPEKHRIPFVLLQIEGKSKREVAQELSLPEGTVASRVRTARTVLRQRLECRGITFPRIQG